MEDKWTGVCQSVSPSLTAVAPMIIEAPRLQTVRVGRGGRREVMVTCAVRGWRYNVTWELEGVVIASSNGTSPSELVLLIYL